MNWLAIVVIWLALLVNGTFCLLLVGLLGRILATLEAMHALELDERPQADVVPFPRKPPA